MSAQHQQLLVTKLKNDIQSLIYINEDTGNRPAPIVTLIVDPEADDFIVAMGGQIEPAGRRNGGDLAPPGASLWEEMEREAEAGVERDALEEVDN